jgi:Fe-S cluster assembly protein SufD
VTTAPVDTDSYRRGFERAVAAAGDPPWWRERRDRAMERFLERGFPGPRDEAWRHTPIAPITRVAWEASPPGAAVPDDLPGVPALGGPTAVVVGGYLSKERSTFDGGLPAVEVRSVRDVLAAEPDRLEADLGRLLPGRPSAFADLNSAFAADGVFLSIAPGAVVEEPIHVVHVAAPGAELPRVSYPRLLVQAGRGSQCRIVETWTGPADAAHLTNAVTEIRLQDNARVERYKLQREGERSFHVATVAARLGRDARFADHCFNLGAALSRTDIGVVFEGEGGECTLSGLFMVDGERFTDTHSHVDHAQPHCSSRELYKGVLDGASRGVFHGLVVVRPGAQKTDAWQMNRNLLLSREALVHSTPQLEILADDVKCRHGSTTGQLDPAALFYLRSRGIGEAEARALLTWAFASELVRPVPIAPLRAALAAYVEGRLRGIELGEAAA